MTNVSQSSSQPDPELVNRLIAVQEKELVVRTEELGLRKQSDNNAFEYSKAALEANVQDRTAEREHEKTTLKYSYVFYFLIVLLLFSFLGVALYLNKEQIAIEIIKAIIYLASGGVGGYAFAISKNRNKQQSS